jgi:hypothetical protein
MSLIRQQGRMLNCKNLIQREVAVSLPMCFSAGAGKQGKTNLLMRAIQGESSSAMPQEALGTGGISMPGYGSFTDNVLDVPSSYYSHNFQLHTKEWVQQKKEGELANVPVPMDKHAHVAANHEHNGFKAAQRVGQGKGNILQRSNAHAIYVNLVDCHKNAFIYLLPSLCLN